jgi:hypothetical protein
MPVARDARGAEGSAAAEPAPQGPAISRPIEFWTIEPNEGQSAGGHSAIRVGDLVHHLEHRDDGLILDRRDPRMAFERAYRLEGNRSIEALRLDLPPEVERDLVARLELRRYERRIRVDRLASFESEVAWLDGAIRSGRAAVTVPGLALLDPGSRGCLAEDAAPLASLRDELRARLGRDSLEHRLVAARRTLARSRDRLMSSPPSPSTPRSVGAAGVGAADVGVAEGADREPGGRVRRLAEAVQTVTGLEAILRCRGPAPSRIRFLPERPISSLLVDAATEEAYAESRENGREAERPAPPDSIGDVARGAKARLLEDLVQLIRSDRPDPGLALLLGWARLVVLELSIAEGRLAVLDPFTEGGAPISLQSLGVSEVRLRERARVAQAVVDARRIELAESALPIEQRLERLESAQHDLEHALRGERHRPPESPPDGTRSLAARYASSRVDLPWSGGITLESLAARREAVREQARALRRSLEQDLDYDLFTRNCSTELLDLLEEALATDPATAAFGPGRRRDPEAMTSFIPVVAGRVVARHAPVRSRRRLPGFRALAIERAARGGSAVWIALRESNTITSRIYRPHPDDSIFVFFSGAPIWIRPLAGVGNLVAGLGGTGLGLLIAPWDGGARTMRGLRGIAMSVPELFFFSVRKGSFVVAPGWPPPAKE